MNGRSFLDTNVLVYIDDRSAAEKQVRAARLFEDLWRARTGVLSTQVLQEYFSAATRKLGVRAELARRKVALFSRLDLVQIDLPLILSAIDLHRLHQFSIWDALIVRAALLANCRVLYSEDLQTGRKIDGLEIVNPFE